MKHDKDKADRLAHLLLAQLCGAYDMGEEFGRVSAVLLRSINGNDLSKKVLALRSYGALVQRGCGAAAADAVRATVVPLVRTLSEATLLFSDKKRLGSKDAATLWETNALLECALLVLRLLAANTAASPSDSAPVDDRLLAALVIALQSTDAPVARHAAALLCMHARRAPRPCLAALQRVFGPGAAAPQRDLFALALWNDTLAGAHIMQTLVLLAAAEHATCVSSGTELTPEARLAVQWAAHGLAAPGSRAKLFVATVTALAEHWELFCNATMTSEAGAPTLLESAVTRLDALLRTPAPPVGATQALLHTAETLGRALVKRSSDGAADEDTEKSWSVLGRLEGALRRHAEAEGAPAVVCGQALCALLWVVAPTRAAALGDACAAVFARAPAVFAEVWRSYAARARTDRAFAAPLLAASLRIATGHACCGGASATTTTTECPLQPFSDAWTTALRCDAPATRAHLLALLRAVPAPAARTQLHALARCACVFIGDHARELLGLSSPRTVLQQKQEQQQQEQKEMDDTLLELLEVLETHAIAGTPLAARRDAAEALAKVGLAVPAARAHVRECLAALDASGGVAGLDDACGTLAALVAALDGVSPTDDAAVAALKSRLQTYFNPAVFVL